MTQEALKKVIDCAVSNSIDYKDKSLLCDEGMLKSAICLFAQKDGVATADVEEVYRASMDTFKKRNQAAGAIPFWVPLLYVIGLVLLAVEAFSLITFGFNIVFAFFLVLAISVMGTASTYVRSTAGLRNASKIWKACLKDPDQEKMLAALASIAQMV